MGLDIGSRKSRGLMGVTAMLGLHIGAEKGEHIAENGREDNVVGDNVPHI